MMRIAIAGGGAFAYVLAQELTQSSNAIIVLSSQSHPEFEENLECQVALVDYNNREQLQYTLQGVDLIISTIIGDEQVSLIEAARRARVGRFVPSEFEGPLGHRANTNEPRDRASEAALEALRHIAQSSRHAMQYTVFTCGVFYERFAPGGLGQFGIGLSHAVQNQGDYLVDIGNATAEIVETNGQGRPIHVSMISIYDVARYVAAAIELGPNRWEHEMKMRGDQMTVRDIFAACSNVRGVPFDLTVRAYKDLRGLLVQAADNGNDERHGYIQRLISTANGRYHFGRANLNDLVNQSDVVNVQPMTFREWLRQIWGSA